LPKYSAAKARKAKNYKKPFLPKEEEEVKFIRELVSDK